MATHTTTHDEDDDKPARKLVPVRIVNQPNQSAYMTRVEHAETGELLGNVQAFDVHLDMNEREPELTATVRVIRPGLRLTTNAELLETFQLGSVEELHAEITRLIAATQRLMSETTDDFRGAAIEKGFSLFGKALSNTILRAVLMRLPFTVEGLDEKIADLDRRVRQATPQLLAEHERDLLAEQ